MLNGLWLTLFCLALVSGALSGRLPAVAEASMKSATEAAELSLRLLGPMALWLGFVRVLQEGQWLAALSRPLGRLLRRLLPQLSEGDPALGLMTVNMASNVLGLGNAATPFGLKAMHALQRTNRSPSQASDSMVLFLVLNTSGLAVLPTGMVVLRTSLGSQAPGAIVLPTIASTLAAALCGSLAAMLLARLPFYRARQDQGLGRDGAGGDGAAPVADETAKDSGDGKAEGLLRAHVSAGRWLVYAALLVSLGAALAIAPPGAAPSAASAPLGQMGAGLHMLVAQCSLLLLMGAIVGLGICRGVRIYDAVVAGGKEAWQVTMHVLPFLVAMLAVIGMLRAAGAVDAAEAWLGPLTERVGLPASALPMVLLRPLSGMGSYAVAADIMAKQGPDSLAGLIASTLMGTTETTFYVLALYLGAVGIRDGRHALLACLLADLAGTATAIAMCHLVGPG